MIFTSENFSPLQTSISPRNQDHFWWFLIPWIRFEVTFHNISFSPISTINFSSDLINFEDYIKNFLISLWIRPFFTIIPFNSTHFHQIGKFGIIFDTRLCEIDDLAVSSRHSVRQNRWITSYEKWITRTYRIRRGEVFHSLKMGEDDYLEMDGKCDRWTSCTDPDYPRSALREIVERWQSGGRINREIECQRRRWCGREWWRQGNERKHK